MDRKKNWITRIASIILMVLGWFFGGTVYNSRYCFGDNVFSVIGIPAWSNGTTGTHYPAIVGIIIILVGVGLINSTLKKRARIWVWTIAILILIALNFVLTYMKQ